MVSKIVPSNLQERVNSLAKSGNKNNFKSDSALTKRNLPVSFNVNQNSPNPFKICTSISYSLPGKDGLVSYPVKLEIFNINGQKIYSIDKNQEPGYYSFLLNANSDKYRFNTSGVYICRISAGQYHKDLKMLLVR